MSDGTNKSIEVTTKEGATHPIKTLEEWVNAQLDQVSKGDPNEKAKEKLRSSAQFMRESASYLASLLTEGKVKPEQIEALYRAYENHLKTRVRSLSGSEFITDVSANCRPIS